MLVSFELLDELLADLSRDRVFLGFVEVVGDADHHVADQRTLRVRRGERDVSLERGIEVTLLLVALSQLVLRVWSQQVIGIVIDDLLVGIDRIVPLTQLLSKLAEQVLDARDVLRIGVILHDLLQDAAAVFEVDQFLILASQRFV